MHAPNAETALVLKKMDIDAKGEVGVCEMSGASDGVDDGSWYMVRKLIQSLFATIHARNMCISR